MTAIQLGYFELVVYFGMPLAIMVEVQAYVMRKNKGE